MFRSNKIAVSANMLNKIWSEGERNFCFLFFYFFLKKRTGSGLWFYENTGILFRVGALLFYFAVLLIKQQSGVWNRVGRVSGNTAIFTPHGEQRKSRPPPQSHYQWNGLRLTLRGPLQTNMYIRTKSTKNRVIPRMRKVSYVPSLSAYAWRHVFAWCGPCTDKPLYTDTRTNNKWQFNYQ